MAALPALVLDLGDGLSLGPLTSADAPSLVEAVDDPLLRRWLPLPRPYTLEVAETWCTTSTAKLRADGVALVSAIRSDGVLIGIVDAKRIDWRAMTVELSYWLAADHRGRSIMPTVVRSLSSWLITELGFERVELRIAEANRSSIRVAEKSGFTREGVARNAGFTDTGRVDLVIFSRISRDP